MNELKITIFLGSMLLLAALLLAVRTARFIRRSEKAAGEISGYVDKSDNSPAVYRVGIRVRFTTDTGRQSTASSFFAINPDRYPAGMPIGVRYDPRNPRDAQIDRFVDLWGFELIVGVVGAAALWAGISGN